MGVVGLRVVVEDPVIYLSPVPEVAVCEPVADEDFGQTVEVVDGFVVDDVIGGDVPTAEDHAHEFVEGASGEIHFCAGPEVGHSQSQRASRSQNSGPFLEELVYLLAGEVSEGMGAVDEFYTIVGVWEFGDGAGLEVWVVACVDVLPVGSEIACSAAKMKSHFPVTRRPL